MSEQKEGRRPGQFLIVENDPDIMEMFVMVFDVLGYDIVTASKPQVAVEIAKDIVPDIIYTSLVFNDMNGFELCSRIRQNPKLANTRIIALTGLQFLGMNEVCRQAGFEQYLLKPFTLEALANTIDPADAKRVKEMINP